MKKIAFALVTISLCHSLCGHAEPVTMPDKVSGVSSPGSLADEYARIQEQAQVLAGRAEDIPQRAVALYDIYRESGGNHAFPLIALHGALWARGFVDCALDGARLVTFRRSTREDLDEFVHALEDANRQVFVDTYTFYHFTRLHGSEPDATLFVPAELLSALNEVHAARSSGESLSPEKKRAVFDTALTWEQELSVAPRVDRAFREFRHPALKFVARRPWVRFEYFPRMEIFRFEDFQSKEERIRDARRAYTLAESAGWDRVVSTMHCYGVVFPDTTPEKILDCLRWGR